MRESKSGFTIVELLVVMVIIGILTALGVLSYSKIQASTRDYQRSSKITIIAESLEKYYDQNGEYPSCTAMASPSATVTSTTLKGIDPNVLTTPTATTGTNSILSSCNALPAKTDAISYVGDGSATCSIQNCLEWTISYQQESTGNISTISSRHKTNVISAGTITDLAASNISFTQLDLDWSAIPNALNYVLQRSTDSGFVGNLVNSTIPSNSTTVTGLANITSYYFRVVPNFTHGSSYWSNTVNARTLSLSTPVIAATINSFTQITVSWAYIVNAQSYTIDQSTSSSFTSPTTITGVTALSYAFTGLTSGTTYYYRVRATASGFYSGYSNTASATALILPSPALTATANSSTQITMAWNSLAMAQSYTINYSTSSSFATLTAITGVGTINRAIALAPGTTYYFRVQGVAYGNNGSWSNTATATTPMDAPAAPGISAWMSGATAIGQATAVTCNGGTPIYQVSYNLNDGGTNWPGWAGSVTSFNINEDNKAGFWAYAYCHGPNVDSGTVGGNYASTIRGIDTPAAPGISAWMSGTNAIGATGGVGCAAGSAQYQTPYNVNDGAINWPGWWNGSSATIAASQGYKYGFWSYVYCQGTYTASASAGGNVAAVVRGINTPPTPCYQGPGSFWDKAYGVVNYGCASCPAGTGGGNFTFRSQDWGGGNWGPHPWGFNDSWDTLATDQYVYYWGHYTCGTAYTYTWSAESYTPVLAHHY